MIELSKAIFGKISGSALSSHIGNRLFKGEAPSGAEYPFVVYMVVVTIPDNKFNEHFEDTTIQFSLYSILSGSTEIENMYKDLRTLFDDCSMSITGDTLIWFRRDSATQQIEDHTTPTGTAKAWAYHVDYTVSVKD